MSDLTQKDQSKRVEDLYTRYESETKKMMEYLQEHSSSDASKHFNINERNLRRRVSVYWRNRPAQSAENAYKSQRVNVKNMNKKEKASVH